MLFAHCKGRMREKGQEMRRRKRRAELKGREGRTYLCHLGIPHQHLFPRRDRASAFRGTEYGLALGGHGGGGGAGLCGLGLYSSLGHGGVGGGVDYRFGPAVHD